MSMKVTFNKDAKYRRTVTEQEYLSMTKRQRGNLSLKTFEQFCSCGCGRVTAHKSGLHKDCRNRHATVNR